jgi:hypothetical protein
VVPAAFSLCSGLVGPVLHQGNKDLWFSTKLVLARGFREKCNLLFTSVANGLLSLGRVLQK